MILLATKRSRNWKSFQLQRGSNSFPLFVLLFLPDQEKRRHDKYMPNASQLGVGRPLPPDSQNSTKELHLRASARFNLEHEEKVSRSRHLDSAGIQQWRAEGAFIRTCILIIGIIAILDP